MENKSTYVVKSSSHTVHQTYSSFIKISNHILSRKFTCTSISQGGRSNNKKEIISYIISFYKNGKKTLLVITDEFGNTHALFEKTMN